MIKLQDIRKTYQMGENSLEVLHGVHMHVRKGEMVALMGPSGAGKSTTMNIVGLLDRPTSGEYYLNGKEVSTLDSDQRSIVRNQDIGFVFQSFFLLPRLTAIRNVGLPLIYRGVPSAEINKRAQACLDKVEVGNLAHHKPSEMSGGQQQRVAIARALVGEPNLILADEPTGALDSHTSQAIMDLLLQLNQQDGVTIVVVTHDPEVGEQCQRIIQIEDGVNVSS